MKANMVTTTINYCCFGVVLLAILDTTSQNKKL